MDDRTDALSDEVRRRCNEPLESRPEFSDVPDGVRGEDVAFVAQITTLFAGHGAQTDALVLLADRIVELTARIAVLEDALGRG